METAAEDRTFGVWTATALVVGGMIGAGIFVLPAQLAPYGWWSVGAWAVAILGSLALALVFIALHRAHPQAQGAVALVEIGLGPLPGMLVGWSYWLSILATNAVMALAAASYASVFAPVLSEARAGGLFAILLIAAFTALNILGTRAAGRFQVVATLAKLILLVVATGLLVAVFAGGESVQALPSELGEASPLAPLTATMFALLGFEAATVAAARVRDPARNWSTFNVAAEGTRPAFLIEITAPETAVLDRSDKLEEFEIAREGDEISIAFNVTYVLEVLGVLDCEGIFLELTEPLSPAMLRPVDGDDYLMVIMPMQVQ